MNNRRVHPADDGQHAENTAARKRQAAEGVCPGSALDSFVWLDSTHLLVSGYIWDTKPLKQMFGNLEWPVVL
eukprot:1606335-Prymnesium_polylepis.1